MAVLYLDDALNWFDNESEFSGPDNYPPAVPHDVPFIAGYLRASDGRFMPMMVNRTAPFRANSPIQDGSEGLCQ